MADGTGDPPSPAEELPMTLVDQHVPVLTWTEPEGIAVRGTLVVIPGRGEQPEHYDRFGRRIAADGYRVHAVTDPTVAAELAASQISSQLTGSPGREVPGPRVLAGSDTGALFAAGLGAAGRVPGLDALVLVGLPTTEASPGYGSWEEELDTRTACPAHRGRLSGPGLRRGALYEPVPAGWAERADLSAVTQPILGIHGTDDPVSPLAAVRARYATAASAELVSIASGRHDALNDVTHRTVAATIVLFLERLRLGADLPRIAIGERLGPAAGPDRPVEPRHFL
jgi:pimeloyl-ACP methyl ester carboxylesterase